MWYLIRQRATLVILANAGAQPLEPMPQALQGIVLEHLGA